MPTKIIPSVFLLAALVPCDTAGAQRGVHVDPSLGVKIRPPNKWGFVGSDGSLGSLRAMFACPRTYKAKTAEHGVPHTPALRILSIAKQATSDAAAKKTDGDGLPMRTPYTSFEDYIARVHGPRTRVASVATVTLGGFEGKRCVARVSRDQGDLTLDMFVIKTKDGTVVFEFEIVSDWHAKLKKQFDKSFASLAAVPNVATKDNPDPPLWESDPPAWKKLSAADRAGQRKVWGGGWLAARTAMREAGWKQYKSPSFLVLSRVGPKFSKRVVKAAEIARKWVDDTLAKVSDEAVMPAVLRIFASIEELTAYRARAVNPLEYYPSAREIHFYKDARMGNSGDGFGPLIRGVFKQYLYDKDPLVQDNMPRWLDNGLWGYMDSSKIKSKKIIFFPSSVEIGRYNYHRNNNSAPKLWGLIQEKATVILSPKDGGPEAVWGFTPECARLLRWFVDGGGKHFAKDDFLAEYLAEVGVSAAAAESNPEKGVDYRRMEEYQARELRKQVYKRRDTLLVAINYKVIPLSVEAWTTADAAFNEYNAKFKSKK